MKVYYILESVYYYLECSLLHVVYYLFLSSISTRLVYPSIDDTMSPVNPWAFLAFTAPGCPKNTVTLIRSFMVMVYSHWLQPNPKLGLGPRPDRVVYHTENIFVVIVYQLQCTFPQLIFLVSQSLSHFVSGGVY